MKVKKENGVKVVIFLYDVIEGKKFLGLKFCNGVKMTRPRDEGKYRESFFFLDVSESGKKNRGRDTN